MQAPGGNFYTRNQPEQNQLPQTTPSLTITRQRFVPCEPAEKIYKIRDTQYDIRDYVRRSQKHPDYKAQLTG